MNIKGKKSPIYLKYILTAFLFLSFTNIAQANNLKIGWDSTRPISLTQNSTLNTKTVTFDIKWDNSWRDLPGDISSGAGNYDAAWVFMKYSTDGGITWNHAHIKGSGYNNGYTNPGTTTQMDIIVPADNLGGVATNGAGAFIQRNGSSSQGNIDIRGVQLVWDYGPAGISDAQASMAIIKVFGIEMVFIPTASFNLGSGGLSDSKDNTNSTPSELRAFHYCVAGSNNSAHYTMQYLVKNNCSICMGNTTGGACTTNNCADGTSFTNQSLCWENGNTANTGSGMIPGTFPNGYSKFYVMKYEISQGQYRDFLNTLTFNQQVKHTAGGTPIAGSYAMTNTSSITNRDSIRFPATVISYSTSDGGEPMTLICDLKNDGTFNSPFDGEEIATNYLTWIDLTAYAAWSGLRPMSELEFEKAARGPSTSPIAKGEYAWGNSTFIYDLNTVTTSIYKGGETEETDYVSNTLVGPSTGLANSYTNYTGNASSSRFNGPLRVGYAAARSSWTNPPKLGTEIISLSRIHTGGSYYGVMELSGNVSEMVVPVTGLEDYEFKGNPGSGELDSNGYVNKLNFNGTLDWPGRNASGVIIGNSNTMVRGGGWATPNTSSSMLMRVSSRDTANSLSGRSLSSDQGGRCARTAP